MRRIWLHVVLFLATLVTTTVAGAWQADADFLSDPWQIVAGLPFAVTLMSILLVHEMGHYLTSRYHGVKATLPYFIPAPSFIGTLRRVHPDAIFPARSPLAVRRRRGGPSGRIGAGGS